MPETVTNLQRHDEDIMSLVRALDEPESATLSRTKRVKQFVLKDGVFYRKNHTDRGGDDLLVIPKNLVGEILFQNHIHNDTFSGHLGLTKTLHKIGTRFYWDTLNKDVVRYIKGCEDCQARKGSKQRKPGPIQVGLPFQIIGVDLLGSFRRSTDGKTMIIVWTDYAGSS